MIKEMLVLVLLVSVPTIRDLSLECDYNPQMEGDFSLMPSVLHGKVTIHGEEAVAGTEIEAWADGTLIGTFTTGVHYKCSYPDGCVFANASDDPTRPVCLDGDKYFVQIYGRTSWEWNNKELVLILNGIEVSRTRFVAGHVFESDLYNPDGLKTNNAIGS